MPEKKNTIGRFEIIEKIGEGPIGAVYKALDPVIRRTVAIKVVKLYALEESSTFSEVFEKIYRVVRTSTSLNHPNICIIYDLSEEKKIPYITMEFVEGHDVEWLLQKKHQFKRAELMSILQQTCDALDFAHKKGVMHQDLKSTNLLLTSDLRVKITDFGIAGLDEIAAAQTKKLLSIPFYISPEQALGEKVSTACDLFSLGVVMFQLLSGQMPFPGSSAASVIMMIARDNPIMPKDLERSGIRKDDWDSFFSIALAKSANQRFRTAKEMYDALIAIIPPAETSYYPYLFSGQDSTGRFEKTFVDEQPTMLVDAAQMLDEVAAYKTSEFPVPKPPQPPVEELAEAAATVLNIVPPPDDVPAAPAQSDQSAQLPPPVPPIPPPPAPPMQAAAAAASAPPQADEQARATLLLPKMQIPTTPPPAPPAAAPAGVTMRPTAAPNIPPPAPPTPPRGTPFPTMPPPSQATSRPISNYSAPSRQPVPQAPPTPPRSMPAPPPPAPPTIPPIARTAANLQLPPEEPPAPATPTQPPRMAARTTPPPPSSRTRPPEPPPPVVIPQEPPTAAPPPATEPVAGPQVQPSPAKAPTAAKGSSSSSAKVLVAAVIALLLLGAIATAGYFFLKQKNKAVVTAPPVQTPATQPQKPVQPKEPEQPAITSGQIYVETTPPGATVLLNNEEKGMTPVTVPALPFGKYMLKVDLKGYQPIEQEVEISAQAPALSLPLTLEKAAPVVGILVIDSNPPGASILIGKRASGVTPYTSKQMRVGKYDITIHKDGYQDYKGTVRVKQDQTVTLKADLVEIPKPPPPPPPVVEKPKEPEVKPGMLVSIDDPGVTAPKVTKRGFAKVPEAAKRFTGAVTMDVLVSETGKVMDIKVVKSANAILDQAAIESVKTWVYQPATKKGIPVKVRIQVTMSFQGAR